MALALIPFNIIGGTWWNHKKARILNSAELLKCFLIGVKTSLSESGPPVPCE